MNNSSLFRIGGAAAILGVLLMFGSESLPVLLGIGTLLMAVFYFALDRYIGSSALGLAAVGSALVGTVGLFFTGVTPSTIFNVFMVLAYMLPALLAGLAVRGTPGFPRILPILGIVGGALGIVNAIINIAAGGDWTKIANPTMKMLSNLTYYPGALLVAVWLVWASVVLLRAKAAPQQQPA